MQSLCILGRQPMLGLAELESLYGADKVRPAGAQAAVINVDPCLLAFDRLGGSIKFCKILATLDTTNWGQIEKFLVKVSPDQSRQMQEGKMKLGLSLYGFNENIKRIEASGLTLKKAIQKTGRSVRLIPNKSAELNTAQVLHNKLLGENGWELIFVRDGDKTIIAQSIKIQDIEAYSRRDRERPKRDARVGMLPPKLAQIIINLAASNLPEDKLESICEIPADSQIPRPRFDQTILDPFCGTGVILQEALLMGYEVQGTDLEQRMINYCEQNLNWLKDLYRLENIKFKLAAGDATNYKWQEKFNIIATETYLGRPFTSQPTAEVLAQTISDCNLIIKKFLRNIGQQIPAGTRLCLAVPAWFTVSNVERQIKSNEFRHLPLIDQLEDLGYNRVSFEHVRSKDLLYYRSDQIVARELLVITRK